MQKIWFWLKINFFRRLRPRATFRWIFSTLLWLILICYLGFGIYLGISIYRNHLNTKIIKITSNIYPLPAAVVGGKTIWSNAYYSQLSYIEQFSAKTKQPLGDAKKVRTQIINQLVENKILQIEAAKYGVRVSKSDINNAYQKIVEQAGGEMEVKKVLTGLYGMSERQFRGLIKDQVLKEKIQNELIAQANVQHIFLKDGNKAKEVAQKAKKGENFASLAKQFSEDVNSRDKSGKLGWVSKGQYKVGDKKISEFDDAIFKAKIGEVVGPVKTSVGFEIIKVSARKGKITEDFNVWLENLKKHTKVWRFIK